MAIRNTSSTGDERLTYAEAGQLVANFSAWLASQGIGSGDRVAIAMRNYPEWIVAYWGVIAAGAVVVGMNAWWVADEMAYALEDSEPRLLIADDPSTRGVCANRGPF